MIDEDIRFPNRKKHDWEQPHLDDPSTDAASQDPGGNAEAEQLPFSTYKVVGYAQETPGHLLPEAEPQVLASVSAAAEEQKPAVETPIPRTSFYGLKNERILKFAESPARVLVATGVGLGILLGVAVATVLWLISPPQGRYDLGSVTSSAAGLTGHLFIQWDKKVDYRLAIKTSDPEQQAGFALAVGNSPRPLAIEIHLLDSEGFVLCSRNILLKYDARNAIPLDSPDPDALAEKADTNAVSSPELEQGMDFTALDAQETAREQGNDIFQNQIGANAQLEAINAQGKIPCSRGSYKKAMNWSFTPDFPSLAEQAEWLQRENELLAGGGDSSSESTAARKRRALKAAAKLLPFSMEGDDTVVDFDPSSGIMQTRGRKTFFVGKTSGAAADPVWQDYPVSIHYRCDRSAACVITSPGAGVLRAQLR